MYFWLQIIKIIIPWAVIIYCSSTFFFLTPRNSIIFFYPDLDILEPLKFSNETYSLLDMAFLSRAKKEKNIHKDKLV